jgi:acyl-CoA thioester hydrolase
VFVITISPRFGDADALGHINNTVLALWFETARNPLFRMFSPDLILSPESWPLIMAHTDYDFVEELKFQYDVEIRTWIARIGAKSFTACHEAWQEGRLRAKGSAVIVHYDFNTRRSTPIPEDKRRLLAGHLRPAEGAADSP